MIPLLVIAALEFGAKKGGGRDFCPRDSPDSAVPETLNPSIYAITVIHETQT